MRSMSGRKWRVAAAAVSGAALLRAGEAAAQAYPQRPVKIIVPYAAGGGTDVFSRLLAAQIERELGQTLIIENTARGARASSARRRWRTPSPTATPSAWSTARS